MVKVYYMVLEKEEDAFYNEVFLEIVLDKLTPIERAAVYHYFGKKQTQSFYVGVAITALGATALIFELLFFLVV